MKKVLVSILLLLICIPAFSQNIAFNSNVVTSPTSATTAAGVGSVVTGIGKYASMGITATLQGGVGGTLDVYIQTSYDAGVTWYDYAHFPQLAAGAAATTKIWTVSKYQQQLTLTAIGSGLAPALAVNTIIGGAWGDQLRIVFVSGAGTSSGASQKIDYFFTQ